MKMLCPLCADAHIIVLDTIRVSDLCTVYERGFGIDVRGEFGEVKEIFLCKCTGTDLEFFSPMVAASEGFYEKLQTSHWYYMDEKNEYVYASQYIKKTDHVLEVGCGKGAFSKLVDMASYLGLEFSAAAQAQGVKEGIPILRESIQDHASVNKGRYDVVCSFQVLEHVSGVRSFIQSCVDCLKPGGLLLYSVPSADSYLSREENSILNLPPHHLTWWSDASLKNVAPRFGLELIGLEHEKLADSHLQSYAREVARKSLRRCLGLRAPLLGVSVKDRFINLLSEIIGRFYVKGLSDPFLRPIGQSVTVVYRKTLRPL